MKLWYQDAVQDVCTFGPEKYDVRYVAGVLAKLNRFAGHTKRPYSVAQHALLCSYLAQPGFEFEALHHDDEEAFGGDIISPMKSDENRAYFQAVRAKCVAPALGLKWKEPKEVKRVDLLALQVEQVRVQGRPYEDALAEGWFVASGFWVRVLTMPMGWRLARALYLARHWWLTRGR